MTRICQLSAVVVLAAASLATGSVATAQLLTDHLWIGGAGDQQWQVDANWDQGTFPNDPGREDTDMTVIEPVIGANLSVALGANLNVDVGATDVTVAALTIGGTTAAVTTNVTSSGGMLVFENFELNGETDPENVICAFNCGDALITSQGVVGAMNNISAVVGINDRLDVAGPNNITMSGGVEELGGESSLRAVSLGTTVFVTGNITTLDMPVMVGDIEEDVPLALNDGENSQGTLDISGVITGAGRVQFGGGDIELPAGTVIVRGDNTYSGRTILARGNLVLAHDNALGTGDAKQVGPANQLGYNLISDNDERTISNEMIFSQWQTIKGGNSLEWSGIAFQDNARGWVNVLPDGKTLTLSGGQYANHTEEMPPLPGRFLTFDGSGKTVITGGLHDEWSTETETANPGNFVGSFQFRGTGTVVVSGGNSTYTGDTAVQGGNVHFATLADLGQTAKIVSSGGAVGVDTGVAGNDDFLDLLNNEGSTEEFDDSGNTVYDTGGLMLATNDAAAPLDFTSGPLNNAASMSVAAPETGLTYTGTITPANSTYRLGGGSGTITLPNANQLTGASNLVAINGGEVHLSNVNDYTGRTTIMARYQTTLQTAAEADTLGFEDGDVVPNDQQYVGTTLTATSLGNGGAPSSIGSSASDATNLVIQGSTLKYVGGATSTNRLFTVGTGGAAIDASGTGALTFANSGALAIDVAEARTGDVNAFKTTNSANNRINVFSMPNTDDLQPGMPIMSPNLPTSGDSGGIPADTVITRVVNRHQVQLSNAIVGQFTFADGTEITFGPAPERKLTLTGSSTANNTLAPLVGDASDGGVVGITKTGAGKWILEGDNSYTGSTDIEGGTLLINGSQTGAGVTTVAPGATLGGIGTLGGDVVMQQGSTLTAQFTAGAIDPLAIVGDFDLSALDNTLSITGTGTGSSWVLATYSGALTGAFESIGAGFTVDYGTGTNSQITLMGSGGVLAGDYNANGIVDAADYTVWRDNLGDTFSMPNDTTPGTVTQEDYNVWKVNFGTTAGSGALANHSAVPEPAGVVLAAFGCVSMVMAVRRKRPHPILDWNFLKISA